MSENRPEHEANSGLVLLTGGTAQVGLHLLPILQSAGFQTLALSRKILPGSPPSPCLVKGVHWLHPDQFKHPNLIRQPGPAEAVFEPELLISAGPISLAVELLQHTRSIRRVVCLSTSSVFTKADSVHPAERGQIAVILQAEQQLQALCAGRCIALGILRPTLIYGCGRDENISRIAAFIRRFGFFPLAGRASGLRQPIHVADLAALMLRVSQSGPQGFTAYAVTGGSTLSYREMVVKIFEALDQPARLPSLPAGLMSRAVGLAGKLAGVKGLNAAMVLRQNQDLVFDDREVRQAFDFRPRPFEPGPGDFTLPAGLQAYLPTT